ncbi:MAG: sulfite exporter TauE/SafE family protein [Bdellovibrionota bacterium]
MGYFAFFLMGITLGTFGGGGSILTLPILVYFFAVPATEATFYSLFVVGIAALMGALPFVRKEGLEIKKLLLFLVPSFIGVFIARRVLLPAVPATIDFSFFQLTRDAFLIFLFSLLMVVAAWRMLRPALGVTAEPSPSNATFKLLLAGLFVGALAGFLGAGGGFMIVPALVLLVGWNMKKAIGNSLVIISLQSLFGFILGGVREMPIQWELLVFSSLVAVAGILSGRLVLSSMSDQSLKRYFSYFILLLGLSMAAHQLWKIAA